MRRLAVALLLAAACGPRVSITHHPPIPLHADETAFAPERTGCKGNSGSFDCEKGPLADLGCNRITVDDLLGGLPFPTAHCWRKLNFKELRPPDGEYIRNVGGILPLYERLVILDHGQYRVLKNMPEVNAALKPVTSEAQALSTAVVITAAYPVYGIEKKRGLRYFVPALEDTFVTREGDDFIVHNLQQYAEFGCGPHPTYLVTVRIPRNDDASEIRRVKAFEDPKEDKLCTD